MILPLLLSDPAIYASPVVEYGLDKSMSCHAATLEITDEGFVAAWFAGPAEGDPGTDIWMARVEAPRWTRGFKVADDPVYACWNPVLFKPKEGPLMLFYKVGPSPQKWWGMLKTSEDNGRTWSEGQRLPDGILGPIKNRPVQLENGEILCPSSAESGERWTVHFERTSDLGTTWTRTLPVNDGRAIQAIQPSILRLENGNLLAVGRTRQNRIFEIESDDDGETWGEMRLGMLPNPNSGTDAITLADGRHLMFYNHLRGIPGRWRGERSPLNMAVSEDGRYWQAVCVVDSRPGEELSYPSAIQGSDGKVYTVYTHNRHGIVIRGYDPAKIEGRDFVDGEWPPNQ